MGCHAGGMGRPVAFLTTGLADAPFCMRIETGTWGNGYKLVGGVVAEAVAPARKPPPQPSPGIPMAGKREEVAAKRVAVER
jgi:hypothetical protein